jgi:hypothetical protein
MSTENFLYQISLKPEKLMRLALVGDGIVKYATCLLVAKVDSGVAYEDAHLAISKMNSNAYMISYVKEKWQTNSKRIPDKHLADLFEALLGYWHTINPEIAHKVAHEYAVWALEYHLSIQ